MAKQMQVIKGPVICYNQLSSKHTFLHNATGKIAILLKHIII